MKKLILTLVLAIAFTFSYGQTCGDLVITNNTSITYTLDWTVGNAPTCSTVAAGSWGWGLVTVAANAVTVVTAPVPVAWDWMGVHILTPKSDPHPNPFVASHCYATGTKFPVTWTSGCSILIQ